MSLAIALKLIIKKYYLRILVGAAFVLFSTWQLSYSPATWFDEGINVGIAKEFADHGVLSLPISPTEVVTTRQFLITSNYPILLPVALSLKLFGISFGAARIPAVIYMWLLVILAYVLVRRESASALAALATTALLITFVPFYGNGKDVLGEVPGLVFFLATLLVLPFEYKPFKLIFTGLLLGLCVATKPYYLVVGLAFVLGEIWRFRKSKMILLKRLCLVGLGTTLPLVAWLYTIVPSFTFNGFAGVFAFYSNSYADAEFLSLIIKNMFRFFTESTPLHLLAMATAVVFFVVKKFRKNEPVSEIKIILLSFIAISLLWYLKTPGWYRYFFSAHLVLIWLFPEALFGVFSKRNAVGIIIIFVTAQSFLLLSKINDPLYFATETSQVNNLVNSLTPAVKSVLYVNAPSAAFLDTKNRVYQMLQINPVLYFGRPELVDEAGNLYDLVVVNGSLSETAFKNHEDLFKQKYRKLESVGHYQSFVKL